jgi:hypothetical protein
MSLATATTTPRTDGSAVKVLVDPLHLDEIPNAMRAMGWTVAPQLMEHWFSIKPAYVMKPELRKGENPLALQTSQYNDSIVTIEWLQKNSKQWAEGSNRLKSIWHSEHGVLQLKKRLLKSGWISGMKQNISLGSNNYTARECDAYSQINFLQIGSLSDTIDDVYGAVGNGVLKIAVCGYTTQISGVDHFQVTQTGLYLRDTYDFTGDNEPLGIWSRKGVLSKAGMAAYAVNPMFYAIQGYVPVFNRDFRRWQDAHNSGGDFVVYSNVQWESSNLLISL